MNVVAADVPAGEGGAPPGALPPLPPSFPVVDVGGTVSMLPSEQRALPNDGCWDTFSKLWHHCVPTVATGSISCLASQNLAARSGFYAAAMFLVLDLVVPQRLGAPSRASSRCCWPHAGHASLAVGTAPRRRRGLTQHSVLSRGTSVGRCSQSARSWVPLAQCGPLSAGVCQKQAWSQLRALSALPPPLGSSGSRVSREHMCLAEFSKRRYCKQGAFRASLASPMSSCAVLARCFRSQKVEKCHVRAFPVLTLLHVQ